MTEKTCIGNIFSPAMPVIVIGKIVLFLILYNMISSRDILKQPDQYENNLDRWDEMVDKPYMSRLPPAGKYINAYKKRKTMHV